MHNVVNALNDIEIVHLKMVNYMIHEIPLNFTLQCMMNLYPSQNHPTRGTDVFLKDVFVCLVVQFCPTLSDSMDCCPPGSFIHGILQARILKWIAISFSGGASQSRD